MGLMALTRFHLPIRIMHGVHMKMIVPRLSDKASILISKITTVEFVRSTINFTYLHNRNFSYFK